MSARIDTVKYLLYVSDSLRNKISSHTSGVRYNEPQVQAAIIIGAVTIFTVLIGFALKDYIIPSILERRKSAQLGNELFRRYKTNLFNAAFSLGLRLLELYRSRSHYLWQNAPQSSFYDYKYKSSVYRLCSLLGWIRAYKMEESEVIINKSAKKSSDDLLKISDTLDRLRTALADGQGIEMYIAKSMCTIFKISIERLGAGELEEFSIELDHLFQDFLSKDTSAYVIELEESEQNRFLTGIEALAKKRAKSVTLPPYSKEEVLSVVSVKLGLIYRDWQDALGDLMINSSAEKSGRMTIKGFREFESIWDGEETDEKKWIQRATKLFEDLNLQADAKRDSRIKQLKLLLDHLYTLLEILYRIDVGPKPIAKKKLDEFRRKIEEVSTPIEAD